MFAAPVPVFTRELKFFPHPPPQPLAPGHWTLEIGPGQGEFLLHQAQTRPNDFFIAVELKRGRFEKIAAKLEAQQLRNVFLIQGDARDCLGRLFSPRFFNQIYILFPDPWPKRRHAKHRLLKPVLLQQLKECLAARGEIYCATDDQTYAAEIVSAFEAVQGFVCQPIDPFFSTYFERKWQALGKRIDYWKFIKHDGP